MRILGIESSCDETAAAVVEDGERLLSNVVNSQIDIHAEYGGVIPEIAARSHLEVINPVIKKALSDADCTWDDIDAIAVTYAPGLIGSLLIGTLAARTLAIIHDKPLYKIHHVEAHVYANFVTKQGSRHIIDKSKTVELTSAVVFEEAVTGASSPVSRTPRAGEATRKEYSEKMIAEVSDVLNAVAKESDEKASRRAEAVVNSSDLALSLPHHQPTFPLLALIVSGGHSQLVLFQGHGDYRLIGQTQDDAVGEAFDKVARVMGLPYPGGPEIDRLARMGDPAAIDFPRALAQEGNYEFSFSGLKSAVLNYINSEQMKGHELNKADIAASFQSAVVEVLVHKAFEAIHEAGRDTLVLAGGVAANKALEQRLRETAAAKGVRYLYPPPRLCTDNAAMIACRGAYQAAAGKYSDLYLNAVAGLDFD